MTAQKATSSPPHQHSPPSNTFAQGRWYFGCYGKPQQLLITDTDFRMLGRHNWDCSLGIETLPGGRLLFATGSCSDSTGCNGKIRT
ncbi:MAG: hypothetical protein ACK524_02840, partial [Planctomyces sp.]